VESFNTIEPGNMQELAEQIKETCIEILALKEIDGLEMV
jgi:hypothetical protein